MNEWDKDNLMFILKSDYATFMAWMAQATDDDINYALMLIADYKKEQAIQLRALKEMQASYYPEVKDFTQAKEVLDKFRL
jgi:hypothetical protein